MKKNKKNNEARYRNRYIPELYSTSKPNIDYGYFDKISLSFLAYSLTFPSRANYHEFKRAFARHGIARQGVTSIAVPVLDGWLFSGRIVFENAGFTRLNQDFLDMPAGVHIRVRYELELNPSTFIHHISRKYRKENLGIAQLANKDKAKLLRAADISLKQQSLDLEDNYIPEPIFKNFKGRFSQYNQFYIRSVIALLNNAIETSFNTTADASGYLLPEQRDWKVSDAECYWEMSCEDALSCVHGLWPEFNRLFYSPDRRDYPVSQRHRRLSGWKTSLPAQSIRNNAAVLYGNLGPENASFCIYAKHYERVRFEVRYVTSIRRFLGAEATRGNLPETLEGLFTALERLKADAHRRLLKVHRNLPDVGYTERSDFNIFADFLQVVAELHKKHEGETGLRNLLASLAANDGLVVINGSQDERLMKALQREMIVQHSDALIQRPAKRQKYYLNPRYANVLQAFREVFARA